MADQELPPYLARNLSEFTRRFDLRGKNVLEIGGCLPKDMTLGTTGARRWIGIDLPDYWVESGDDNPSQNYRMKTLPIEMAHDAATLDHALLIGDIQDIPVGIEPFDAVYSCCAFEHIPELGRRLNAVRRVMRPKAFLFAVADPIWSSPKGDHLLPIVGADGKIWTRDDFALPLWHQLLWTADEMATHLEALVIPSDVAGKAVDWVHRSRHLNRMMSGDFLRMARSLDFSEYEVAYYSYSDQKEEMAETSSMLEMLYPDRGPFNNAGVMLSLKA